MRWKIPFTGSFFFGVYMSFDLIRKLYESLIWKRNNLSFCVWNSNQILLICTQEVNSYLKYATKYYFYSLKSTNRSSRMWAHLNKYLNICGMFVTSEA